ncbi:MAG: hypothetical protein ACXW3K_05930 [Brevundimonas sp.]
MQFSSRRFDTLPTDPVEEIMRLTGGYRLDDIEAAYDLFADQRDGVLKVAIPP